MSSSYSLEKLGINIIDSIFKNSAERRKERLLDAIALMENGRTAGIIYGGEFKSAKENLSNTMENIIDYLKHQYYDSFREGSGSVPSPVNDVLYKYPALTQLEGFVKYLNKMPKEYQNDKFTELLNTSKAWAALGKLVKENKAIIVKGRRPAAQKSEAVIRREEDARTCPCCISKFMVKKDGTMVHHGYQRPGVGYDIGECPGAQRFRPLEESLDGAYFMYESLLNEECELREKILHAPEVKILYKTESVYNKKTRHFETIKTPVYPEDGYKWENAFEQHMFKLKSKLSQILADQKFYKKVMKDWFPVAYPKENDRCNAEREKYKKIFQELGIKTSVENKKLFVK